MAQHQKPSNVTWTLNEPTLLEMLNRCHNGESVDEVYMEKYMDFFTIEED